MGIETARPQETFDMAIADGAISLRLGEAAEAIEHEFGATLDAEYLPGKTLFRDFLWSRFGLSQLEAEELCDSLEQTGKIRFVPSAEGDEVASHWSVLA